MSNPFDLLSDPEFESIAHLASPVTLLQKHIPNFRMRPHQKLISDAVVDGFTGRGPRFIAVSIAQQFGKSLITSVGVPLWILELHALGVLPGGLVGLMSYEDSLAQTWSVKVRRMIEANPDDFNCRLRSDSRGKEYWETLSEPGQEPGGILSLGTAGSPQGRPMTLLGLDDITKNFEQAMSPVHQDKLWNNWTSVLYGRLQPWTVVLVTMVRWAPNDFIGRLASKDYEGDPADWRFIRIPYVCDSEDDPLGREIGEPLLRPQADQTIEQAKREAEQVQKSISTYSWSTLWQQNPQDAQGTIFSESKWRYWGGDLPPEERIDLPRQFEQVIMAWDMTFKDLKESDWVVGGAWGRNGADYYLIDMVRGRYSFTETCTQVRLFKQRIQASYPNATAIVVEDKANGPAVISQLRSKVGGLIEFDPVDYGSKLARAHATQPFQLGGNLYIPAPSERGWVAGYKSELAAFRGMKGDVDDQVDMTTMAILFFQEYQAEGPIEVETPEEEVFTSTALGGFVRR